MEATISTFLAMQKSLKARLNDLNKIKEDSGFRRRFMRDVEEIKEPLYNIKELDERCSALGMSIFKLDGKIKEANAKTVIAVDIDYKELMKAVK